MSQIKAEAIWQHELVLPYILKDLKAKVDVITPVRAIYLYGSRSRIMPKDWHLLEGKDWDIMMICDFPIVNTHVWTTNLNYHIDLTITTAGKIKDLLERNNSIIELYPNYKLMI
ncbi:hypothetical protein ABH942_002621 [Flavobacterium sp. 28YEA47A]|uniref:hypothetical protein n=1 Tax=Flavobacterium sp. 28YEA47A TaxID=3156276 RepID=UPI003517D415